MDEVIVHPRVTERHPELSTAAVAEAWRNCTRMTRRDGEDDQWVAVGFDSSGRAIEMVAKEKDGDFLIYHAMTPPANALLSELGLIRR